LVAIAQATPGVMGARMMGGGFGGCVLALAPAAEASRILAEITTRYGAQIGKTPDALICRAVGGAGEIVQ
jgi:galactokinase